MKKKFVYIVSIAVAAVFATSLTVSAGPYYDLDADNVNINTTGAWYSFDSKWGDAHARIGENSGVERTGYLDSIYADASGKPNMNGNSVWQAQPGHVEFRDGAVWDGGIHSWNMIHPSDPTKATTTFEAGSSFTVDTINAVKIGTDSPSFGTFTVNGGTLEMDNVAMGGNHPLNDTPAKFTESTGKGIFAVNGADSSITISEYLRVSRLSEFQFNLDSSGNVSPINATTELTIYADGIGGGDGGILKIDTSAFETSSGSVDLFNYGSLTGEFGDVQVLGSELSAGNGTDPLTYSLDYGSGTNDTVSLTYNNVPEPSSLFLLGIAGLLLMKRRRV